MDQFPGNSHFDKERKKTGKPDETDKKLEKVISGEATQRKKPIGRRFKDVFIGGEFKTAAAYIGMEVLLPAFRNMLVDGVTKGIERIVYGETTLRRSNPNAPRISYNSPVNRGGAHNARLPDQPGPLGRTKPREVGEILLQTRVDAERILETMLDILNQYDVVSVADLNELAGFPSAFTDNRWGWINLNYADIRQVRDGFLLMLPPAEVI